MKALVLTGGMPQAHLVRELKRRGISSLLADRNKNAPAVEFADKFFPISALDVSSIRHLAITEQVDFVISVCADQMLLVAAQVCQELGLPCYIDYKTAKNVSNKEHMKRIFAENGIPTANYCVCSSFDPKLIKNLSYPLVVKPVDTYSSKGVIKVYNLEGLEKALLNALKISRTGTAIIEEFTKGDEVSVDIYVEEGKINILCIRSLDKIPGTNGFVINRGRYPAKLTDVIVEKIQNTAQKIAEAFHLKNTPMLIQLLVDGDDISVVEFSARTGGGIKYRLIPKVSGFDVVKAVLDLTLGHKPSLKINHYDGYIIDEFLYCYPGVLNHVIGLDELSHSGVIDHYEQYKFKGYEFGSISSSGDRLAYFSIEARNLEELERLQIIAGQTVKAISDTGKDLIRHDIIRFVPY
ncbi:MAG: ATP-grasp domain-containing protein [Saccharofermentanales bacterium]|jgi:biotin carboxylase|nr:ATP-grasp domain-containing protein [Bacillota bacterium]